MKDKRKVLVITLVIILVVALVSTLILSSVYAKYVSRKDHDEVTVQPAAFELIMVSPREDEIEVNFAADGEPGAPIGHTTAHKDFEFKVKTSASDVAAQYTVSVSFVSKITDMIKAARQDKFQSDITCDYEVYYGRETVVDGKVVVVYDDEPLVGVETIGTTLTWKYTSVIEPHKNPDGSAGQNSLEEDIYAHYKLRMIVYNNTTMPTTGNTNKFVFVTNGIDISVSSKQVDPQYVGAHVG